MLYEVITPYFIPLPIISPFGTMGAFINMKSIPKNKKQLFDIGIAGPLSGLIIAIPVLLIGLSLSEVSPLPVQIPEGTGYQLEGNSILYLFLKFIVITSYSIHYTKLYEYLVCQSRLKIAGYPYGL